MNKPIAIISSICQIAFFLAISYAIADFYVYLNHWLPHECPDPRMVKPIVDAKLFKILLILIGGLLGAFLSWIALQKLDERPQWYLQLSAVLAFFWLLVFPVGTLVGFLMFRWRRPLTATHRLRTL